MRNRPSLPGLLMLGALLTAPPIARAAEPGVPMTITDAPFQVFGRTVTATFLIAASPKAVYDVLTDYAHMAEFMSVVDEAKVLALHSKGARVSFRVRYLHFFDIVEIDDRTYEPYRRITWHAVEGPLKVSDGSWTLSPVGKGTKLIYQTDVDPGMPLPSALTGMMLRRGLPEFLHGIRLRAESGGKWRKPH